MPIHNTFKPVIDPFANIFRPQVAPVSPYGFGVPNIGTGGTFPGDAPTRVARAPIAPTSGYTIPNIGTGGTFPGDAPSRVSKVTAPVVKTVPGSGAAAAAEAERARLAEAARVAGLAGVNPNTGSIWNETPNTDLQNRAESIKQNIDQVLDKDTIYGENLKRMQGEIDAQNTLYNDMLGQSRIAGAEKGRRRELSTAALAINQGLMGSNVGEGMVRETESANMQEQAAAEALINEQRAQALAGIRGVVRKSSEAEYTARLKARSEGADAIISNKEVRKLDRAGRPKSMARLALAKGWNIDTLTEEEFKRESVGSDISFSEFKAEFKILKDEQTAETAKTALATKKTEAETAKLVSDTTPWKEMTDYQRESLRLTGIRDANTLAVAREKLTETDETSPSAEEVKQSIRPMLATQSFKDLSSKQKTDYILSQGGDPADFSY